MNNAFKKILLSFFSGAMVFASTIGLLNANNILDTHAAEEEVASAVFNSSNNKTSLGNYTSTWENVTNGFSWTIKYFNNNNNGWNYIKCGRKSVASIGYVETTNSVDYAISKVSITIDALTVSKVNSIKLYVNDTQAGTFTAAKGTQTCTLSSPVQYAKYKIAFDCASGSSNGLVTLSKVALYADTTPQVEVLDSLSISGDMARKEYFVNDPWDPTGFTITANFESGNVKDVTDDVTWSFSAVTGLETTGVVATASYTYEGVTKTVSSQNIDVSISLGGLYDLKNNFSVYSDGWSGYGARTVTHKDVNSGQAATIEFTNATVQQTTITTMPVIAAQSGVASTMIFTLDNSLSNLYTITSLNISLQQWTTKALTVELYKGGVVTGTPLSTLSITSSTTSASFEIGCDNLNDYSFTLNFVSSSTSRQQLGISEISMSFEEKEVFGTVDHIKVTSLPDKVVYSTGEAFLSEGLVVTAYDGADENAANFVDVTQNVTLSIEERYIFTDLNIPSVRNTITYTINDVTHETYFDLLVFKSRMYTKVTENLDDFSGNYLIVSSYESNVVALNGYDVNMDKAGNLINVTENNGNITVGEHYAFTIATYSTGYSIKAHNGNYINSSASTSNTLALSATESVNTISVTDGVATITGKDSTTLSYLPSNNRFRYYQSTTENTASISLYKEVDVIDTASEFADKFLNSFTCDASGETKPTFNDSSWESLKELYDSLPETEKTILVETTGSETGTTVEIAVFRYDYIVAKYGTDTYENFMGRTITSLSINNSLLKRMNNHLETNILAIISIISITSICLFIFKKKKEQISK